MRTLSQTSKRRGIFAYRPCHHIPPACLPQTSACSERIGDLGSAILENVGLFLVPRSNICCCYGNTQLAFRGTCGKIRKIGEDSTIGTYGKLTLKDGRFLVLKLENSFLDRAACKHARADALQA